MTESAGEPVTHLMLRLTRLALTAPDVTAAIDPTLDTFLEHTAAAGTAFFQLDPRGGSFYARTARGVLPSTPLMQAISLHGLPAETPLMDLLRRSDAPLLFDDVSAQEATTVFLDLDVRSLAAAGVRDGQGNLLGAFLMHTFTRHDWTSDEASLLHAAADSVAALIGRLVAEEQAAATREEALHAIGLALEARDRETAGHTDRVTALAVRLGSALGLSESELQAVRWGAYLHDVGKLSVPDAVLGKPGPLNDEEWTVMRAHVREGEQFAAQLGFLPQLTHNVIAGHHERWDGRGYPRGLQDTEIPFAARIFAVVDVYDALTSERPYKHAWTAEQARTEIAAQAGRQFDPGVVAAFMALDADPSGRSA